MKAFFSVAGLVFPPFFFPYFAFLIGREIFASRISGLAMTGIFLRKIGKAIFSKAFYGFVFVFSLLVVVAYAALSFIFWVSDIKLGAFIDGAITEYAVIYVLCLPFVYIGSEILEEIKPASGEDIGNPAKRPDRSAEKEDAALLKSLDEANPSSSKERKIEKPVEKPANGFAGSTDKGDDELLNRLAD